MLSIAPMERVSPLNFVSGVNHRHDPVGVAHPFALLMRPDLEPGSCITLLLSPQQRGSLQLAMCLGFASGHEV